MNKRNIDARSHNHCCRETAAIIIYSECVSVALAMQHAMRMRRTVFVICGKAGATTNFLHYLINDKIFGKRKLYWT